MWFGRAAPCPAPLARVRPALEMRFPVAEDFRTVESGVAGYDFVVLIAFRCKASPSQVPIFRLPSLRINFPLMNWRLAVTRGVRISASESFLHI